MTVFFTADTHFKHTNVAINRGFDSWQEHDEYLSMKWFETVDPDDVVWILGDLTMGGFTYALELLRKLPGKKHLIAGNHDMCHPMHRNAYKFQRLYLEAFESVQVFARRRIVGKTVMLSHFPYHADHTEPMRYLDYRLRDCGQYLLHGHTHSKNQITSPIEIHVGMDAWDLTPVPLEIIESLIGEESVQCQKSLATTLSKD